MAPPVDAEVGSLPTLFSNVDVPVTLRFEEVVYRIKKTVKSDAKTILNGVTGAVFPGEMLAMLGPSGSGKTTLLTALGGRLNTGSISGAVTYNGKPFSNGMKRNTGFVTQDDVLYPHLTVTETLVYTALLRLPSTLSASEKIQQAENVIAQLGLSRCRNSIIGGHFLRGVSGGERKRVSIGQEVLINPSLLFLDEPTSGLDSTTAQRIVLTLRELADGGRTIVMTVHQPSSRLFYMFHKVLLLCEGNPLYFGNASASLDYFASVGFSLTVAMNPADFLLDLANGSCTGDSLEDQALVKQTLISSYRQNLLDSIRGELAVHSHLVFPANDKRFKRWSNSWWQQFSVLFRRGIKERKHESFAGLKIFQVLLVAVLSGLLWFQSHSIQDKVGLLFFTSGFWSFYPLFQAIFTFPKERMMLEKERSSGMYRLSSYFAALTLGDMPMELVLPTAFFTIIYWMAGLKPTPVAFISGLCALLYSVLVSQGLGLAIGAVIMDEKSATILGSVIVLTFLLASGYYVQHVPGFIAWIKYISLTQYTFKVLLLSQYTHDETYLCGNAGGGVCRVGDLAVVKAVGLDGLVVSIVALAVMLIAYRLVAYLALMRLGVTRK